MNSIEDIYNQAINHRGSLKIPMKTGDSVINYGVKIQKFLSKTEILNCGRNGDYFQECSNDEYQLFFIHGWIKGGLRLSMMNYKRKLDLIETKIRNESNTRKNDKHIKKLKSNRENLLIKYSKRQKQLNKIKSNEEKHF
tara:strand:+ start:219 stop:635 length:417 start_codon:yes stop_codon:yes gene_type:complete